MAVYSEMFGAPQFLQSLPAETDATDGDIVTFQTKVIQPESGGRVQVSWWRCGEMLECAPGRREIIQHEDGWNELILSNVSEDDDGEYECRAENDLGFSSCFGSLYYYPRGALGTATDVTLESSLQDEGDGRQSALLILIDDGSHTEEEGGSNKKSLTVSEQMQGIIEDLTQSSQEDRTGSMTIEKEDEEDQFNSDIDDLLEEALQDIRGSQETLVAEASPSEKAMSEGASDPYAVRSASEGRCHSNPNNVASPRPMQAYPWPPEAVVTFDVPPDTSTTSADLPPLDTEEGTKLSFRNLGAETPFGVDDIPEEQMELVLAERDGATKSSAIVGVGTLPRAVAFQDISSVKDDGHQKETFDSPLVGGSTFTSVTDFQDLALLEGSCDRKMYSSSRSSFRSTSLRLTTGAPSVEEIFKLRLCDCACSSPAL